MTGAASTPLLSSIKIHQLEYLVAVADKGSVRSAAQALGLSAAAVSRALIELEASLNTSLLVRQSYGAALTEAGKSLLVHARVILGQIDEATQLVENSYRAERLTLSVGATAWISEALLPAAVARFQHLRPNVSLYLSDVFGASHSSLRDGIVDLAIGLSPMAEAADEFREVRLFSHEMTVVCRKGHPLANARSVEELADADWLITEEIDAFPPPLVALLHSAVADRNRARVHYCKSQRLAVTVVENDDLLWLSPWPMIEAGDLRRRCHSMQLREMAGFTAVTSALTRKSVAPSALVTDFVECLLQAGSERATDPTLRRVFNSLDEMAPGDGHIRGL